VDLKGMAENLVFVQSKKLQKNKSVTWLITLGGEGTKLTIGILLFFFFFYWHYNPLWVLAFSVILFHSALSSHCFLHRLTPIICKSSSMPAIHLFLGLPLILEPIGFYCNILLGVLLSLPRMKIRNIIKELKT
jgi:hypothetical protein